MTTPRVPGSQPPFQEFDWLPGQTGPMVFDRVRLEPDGGSFTQPVTLRLGVADVPPSIPQHLKLPYVFQVEARSRSGQAIHQLARPVRVTVDFGGLTPEQWGKTYVDLYTYDEAAGRWEVVPGRTDMAGRRVVANGYGGKVTYTYEGHTVDVWAPFRRRYRVKTQQVDPGTGTAADGTSGVITRTYGYGPSYNVLNEYDYRGHGEVTVTDSEGHYEKSYFYTRDAVNGKTANDAKELQSRRYKLERWKAGAGAATFREESDWSYVATQGGANFVRLDATRQYQGTVSRKTTNEYDSYGNAFRVRAYDSASAVNWVRSTRRWYVPAVNDAHYIVGKLGAEVAYEPGAGDGNWKRATYYCYDHSYYWNNPIGSGQYGDDGSWRGLLTAVRRLFTGTQTVDVRYEYDACGNRTQEKEYNEYGVTDGAFAAADPRTTTTSYEGTYHTFPQTITNPLNQQEQRVYDAKWGAPTQVTDPNLGVTNYTYDGYGRLTKVEGPQVSGPSGNYRRTTQYTYNLPATSPGGRQTTCLQIQVRTDLGGATPAWRNTWRFYDGAGRVVQEYADHPSGVSVVNTSFDGRGLKRRETVPHAATGSGAFLESDWLDNALAATTQTYDELRRPLVTTLPDTQTTETRYEDWDRLVLDQNRHGKRYRQDALGRVVWVFEYSGADPNLVQYSQTQYGYDILDRLTGVTDAASNPTSIAYDPLGRKTQQTDPDLGVWNYEYDPVGTLKAQTDARGQRIDFFSDKLKRVVRKWYPVCWTEESIVAGQSQVTVYDLMELRSAIDTDRAVVAGLGAFTWTDPAIIAGTGIPIRAVHWTDLRSAIQGLWTAAGLGSVPEFTGGAIVAGTRVIKASDPTDVRNWLVQYEQSSYGQGKRARAYYEYDAYDGVSQFGKGKRTAVWDGSGRGTFTYDKAGRLKREERVVDGTTYAFQWTFDALDRVYQLTFPDGEVLTHSYAANGLLSQMSSSLGPTYLSGVQYNALDLVGQFTLGSGVTALGTRTYYGIDAGGYPYGAVKTIGLQQGSNPKLVDRVLGYDPAGNVTSVNDLVNTENVAYAYDELDRLLTAGAPLNETYAYNAIGNIAMKNGLRYGYDAAHKHGAASYNGVSYGYDACGNMTTRGSQSLKYDPEQRPVRVNAGGAVICRFAYDGDGIRRKRLDSNGTVHYLGAYERNLGKGDGVEVVTKYYHASLGSQRRLVAFRRGGTLYYVGTDHLGSTVRVVDANFAAVDQMRYKVYGESRDAGANLQTDHKFTSQIEDAAIGKDYDEFPTGRSYGDLAIADDSLVVVMAADPYPYVVGAVFDCQGAMGETDSGRPETSHLLELKRRVPRVLLQQLKALIGQILYVLW